MNRIARTIAFAAAVSTAVSTAAAPAFAADPRIDFDAGERRSSASAGLYFAIPFGGARSGRTQGGVRMRMTHDYRSAASPRARVIDSDALELRLIGERRPTLFVANRPLTGRENRHNLVGGGIVSTIVIGLAVVGAFVIYNEIKGDDDEDCLDPNLCD
jgi:hypothetical protein